MKYNRQLTERIAEVAEVAGYLWQKGWAERNGGNITVNITEHVDDVIRAMAPISGRFEIGRRWANPLRWPVRSKTCAATSFW